MARTGSQPAGGGHRLFIVYHEWGELGPVRVLSFPRQAVHNSLHLTLRPPQKNPFHDALLSNSCQEIRPRTHPTDASPQRGTRNVPATRTLRPVRCRSQPGLRSLLGSAERVQGLGLASLLYHDMAASGFTPSVLAAHTCAYRPGRRSAGGTLQLRLCAAASVERGLPRG